MTTTGHSNLPFVFFSYIIFIVYPPLRYFIAIVIIIIIIIMYIAYLYPPFF